MLLLGALALWPYGYHTFLRWVVCMTALMVAFRAHDSERFGTVWTLGLLALLFNPSNSNTPNPCSNRGLLGRDPKMGSAVLLPARLVMVAAGRPILPVADRAESVGRHTK